MERLTLPLELEFVNSWAICCLLLHLYFMSFVLEKGRKKRVTILSAVMYFFLTLCYKVPAWRLTKHYWKMVTFHCLDWNYISICSFCP